MNTTRESYFELLKEICGGEGNAYAWLFQAVEVACIFDHIMDGDEIDKNHFEVIMKGVLLEWGINDFFLRNSRYLIPVMSASMSAWQHATGDMKRIKEYDLYSELPCAVAFLREGQGLVDKVSPRLRTLVEQLMKEDNERDSQR